MPSINLFKDAFETTSTTTTSSTQASFVMVNCHSNLEAANKTIETLIIIVLVCLIILLLATIPIIIFCYTRLFFAKKVPVVSDKMKVVRFILNFIFL